MALALRKEEGLGLGIAIAAHAALVAILLLRPHSAPVVLPPERIEVTISDEVALTSTSPEPNSQAAAPVAPTLGEPQPPEQAEQAQAEPAEPAPPEPAPPRPAPPTPPRPAPKPSPRPTERPAPRPTSKPTPPKPAPKPAPAKPAPAKPTPAKPAPAKPAAKAPPRKAPAAKPATKAPAQRTPAQAGQAQKGAAKSPPARTAARSNAPAGGSRIGSDFLEGVSGAKATNRASTSAPAAAIGPEVRSSLASAISRQLKPKWQAPQGPDAEDLVTILSFNLNRDGSLAGAPQVVRQLGLNDLNRNQADRHAEQAIRAVRLAAPFDLPEEHYSAWKRVSSFRFDKRLSQ